MRKFSLNVVNISKKYSRKKPLVPEKMRGGASMIVLELNFFYLILIVTLAGTLRLYLASKLGDLITMSL